MAIQVKVGVTLDNKGVQSQLNTIISTLENKKIPLKFDMTQVKQLQTMIVQLSKAMSGLKIPNVNTSGASNVVKQVTDATKQQNTALKEQQSLYTQAKNLQNEEFAIKKKMIGASGEYGNELSKQLSTVMQQESAIKKQLDGTKQLTLLEDQREKKNRDLTATMVKYQQSMDTLKKNAINNLDTKGLSTKQIDEYKSKIESINTVNMGQVKSEIASVNKELENGRKSAQEMAEGMKRSGDAMSSAGGAILKAFAIPAGALGLGVKTFADFEYQMTQLNAVSDVTGGEFQQLTDLAKQMGKETSFSAVQAAEALTEFGRSGFTASEMMSLLPTTLDLTVASGEQLSVISNIMSDGMRAFGLSASEASNYANILAKSANASNIGVGDIAESFKYAAPLAKSLGFSVEDVATQLAIMGNNSIKAETAGTSMRGLLTNLALEKVA